MNNIKLISIFSLINFIAWNFLGILFIINIVIIFFLIQNNINKKGISYLGVTYILNLSFNISATFWLLSVNVIYGISTFFLNALIMTTPYVIIYLLNKLLRKCNVYILFSFLWLILEWIHTKWYIAWNWLTYGHVLSNQPYLAQWYSILGTTGGSIWLLFTSFLLFVYITHKNIQKKALYLFFILFFIPSVYSVYVFFNIPIKNDNKINVLTYIPEYNEKKKLTNFKKTKILFKKIKTFKGIDFLLCPETFFEDIYPSEIKRGNISIYLKKITTKNPELKIVFGAKILNENKSRFNTIGVFNNKELLFRTKKKYVPLTEYTPKYLTSFLGITYFTKNETDNQEEIIQNYKIFPIVCYESVFSNFIASEIGNAEIIFLLASEEFLNDSYFAKKQYLNIVRLRAIENKRNIIKCSNKGISCVINEKGIVVNKIQKEIEKLTAYKIKDKTIFQKLLSL